MPKARNAVHLVSTRVSPEDVQALDYIVARDRTTPSRIVRQALRDYLSRRVMALAETLSEAA